jgi:hypothetical protein
MITRKDKILQINKIVRNGPTLMTITSSSSFSSTVRVQLIKRLVDLRNQSLMKRPPTHAQQQQQPTNQKQEK